MKLRKQEKTAVLILADLIAMFLAFVLAMYAGYRTPVSFGTFLKYDSSLVIIIASTFFVFIILDIYSLHKMPAGVMSTMIRIGIGLAVSSVVTTAAFFLFRDPVPRAVYLLFYPFAWTLIGLFRFFHTRFTLSQIYWKVLLVGEPGPCEELALLISRRKYLQSTVVGYLSTGPGCADAGVCPCLGPGSDLMATVTAKGIDQIVVVTAEVGPQLMKELLAAMKTKVKVHDQKQVIEVITGKVPIERLNDTWFIDELASVERRYYWYLKRTFDIAFAGVGLAATTPVMLLAAVLVRLDSKGPLLYSQTRIGRRGVPFRVWKLRTMVSDADKNGVHWTLENDCRITRIGRILRKLHIDEFPQFWNILKGDMSMIGPRPEAEALVALYTKEIPYYQERHMVTPGVTGWAQINYRYGNSVDDTREKLKYDFFYIKNRNFFLDLLILLRTIRTVVTGRGAI
jgi:exopolysaccharide biosynthesis polyprenyl glycosylphosphotransferase